MKTRLTLKPGRKGTKSLVNMYGERLVCIRYRYDPDLKKRFKTVELIVDEADWEPSSGTADEQVSTNSIVFVRVAIDEVELREKVKNAGAWWNPKRKLWEMRYGKALELGVEERIQAVKCI